jgi:hypothetical protein
MKIMLTGLMLTLLLLFGPPEAGSSDFGKGKNPPEAGSGHFRR